MRINYKIIMMQSETQESFLSQNNGLIEMINQSYQEQILPFMYCHDSDCQEAQYSFSTITVTDMHGPPTFLNYHPFLSCNPRGDIAVPISDSHWLYIKTIKPNQKQHNSFQTEQLPPSHKNVQGNQKILFPKLYNLKQYQVEAGLTKVIDGKEILIHRQYAQEYPAKQASLYYQLTIFQKQEDNNKSKTTSSNFNPNFLDHKSNKSYFGLYCNKNFKTVLHLEHDTIQDKRDQQASHDYLIPMFVHKFHRIYLKGFKGQKCKIIFGQKLHQLLNQRVSRVFGKLNLGNENVGRQGLQYISTAPWKNLESINLWWNMIGEQGAKVLSKGVFIDLCQLDLRKNYIGNKGFEYLCATLEQKEKKANSRSYPNLKILNLTDNNLSSVGKMNNIVFPNLMTLQLQNNQISLSSLANIQIPLIHSLKNLSLRNNLISGEGLGTLRLPNLQVLYLSNNRIVTCQSLIYAQLPKLRLLSLGQKQIKLNKMVKEMLILFEQIEQKRFIQFRYQQCMGYAGENEINQLSGLEMIDWINLSQFKIGNQRKKTNMIKEQDKINSVLCMSKWNIIQQNKVLTQDQDAREQIIMDNYRLKLLIPNSQLLYFKSGIVIASRRNLKLKDFVKFQI